MPFCFLYVNIMLLQVAFKAFKLVSKLIIIINVKTYFLLNCRAFLFVMQVSIVGKVIYLTFVEF